MAAMSEPYRNPLQEILSAVPDDARGITLTRDQLNAWTGWDLTDEQVEQLEDAIPNSSIPDAVAEIMEGIGDGG
jgi:hypothetical protein